MFLNGFTSFSVLLFFPLSIIIFFEQGMLFHLTLIGVSQSTYLLIYLSLETLINAHHKDWLTYSSGTDTPGKQFPCKKLSSLNSKGFCYLY